MYAIVAERKHGKFGILDTSDGTVEYYSPTEIKEMVKSGLLIKGAFVDHGKIKCFIQKDILDKLISKYVFTKTIFDIREGSKGNLYKFLMANKNNEKIILNSSYTVDLSYIFTLDNKQNQTGLNLTLFDTSQVKIMNEMFFNFNGYINGIENMETYKVTNMSGMFRGCMIPRLDLHKWFVANVEDLSFMFEDSVIQYLDLSYWNLRDVFDMEYVFQNAKIGTLNMEGLFLPEKVEAYKMFNNCEIDTLIVSDKRILEMSKAFDSAVIKNVKIKIVK